MKKFLLLFAVFCLFAGAICAQSSAPNEDLSLMNSFVRGLAPELNKKIMEERAGTVAMGDFSFEGSIRPLGLYWSNQLTAELVSLRGSYTVLSGESAAAGFSISGEIVELANTIRVYTRIIRSSDRAIRAVFFTDFERNVNTDYMLSSGDGRRRSSMIARDSLENDSWESPAPCQIGLDDSARFIDRNIHSGSDEDFFLLLPDRDGRLQMETTGNTDTYLEFYLADSREKLASNDDGGSGSNARIRYNVTAGRRYIIKVRGYDSDITGLYGFRAHYIPELNLQMDEYENDNNSSTAKSISIGERQQRTFHNGDDVDWVRFQVTQRGRYVMRARGVNDNDLDTFIALYSADMNSIAENDDGGEGLDARLSASLEPGFYYCKISCLDDEPDQPYIFSVERE